MKKQFRSDLPLASYLVDTSFSSHFVNELFYLNFSQKFSDWWNKIQINDIVRCIKIHRMESQPCIRRFTAKSRTKWWNSKLCHANQIEWMHKSTNAIDLLSSASIWTAIGPSLWLSSGYVPRNEKWRWNGNDCANHWLYGSSWLPFGKVSTPTNPSINQLGVTILTYY